MKKFFIYTLAIFLLLPAQSQAICDANGNVFGKLEAPLPGVPGDTVDSIACSDSPILTYINFAIKLIIAVIVILSLIMVVLGGYRYMVAGGDATQVSKAKSMVSGALLGIIIALTAFVVLNTISPQFASGLKEPGLKVVEPPDF